LLKTYTIAQSFKSAYQFVVQFYKTFLTRAKPVKEVIVQNPPIQSIKSLKKEIEKLKEEGLPVKEIIKEIEVSRVTKVQPIKEITKETITIDDEALTQLQARLTQLQSQIAEIQEWGTDIEGLQYTTAVLQSSEHKGAYRSLGISGSAGVRDLTVTHSTTLGSSARDALTVNATSTFKAPVTAEAGLTVGTENNLLEIDSEGNLTTTGTITATGDITTLSNLTVEGNLTVSGAQTYSGAAAFITNTTPQLTLGFDDTHIVTFSVDNTGDLTMDATGGDIFFDDDNLLVGRNLTVGLFASSDDDYVYFDDGASEYLMWDEAPGQFVLSDDLILASNLGSAATEVSNIYLGDDGGLYFGADQNFLIAYDETTDNSLELSDGGNTFLSVSDTGSVADFAFNTDDLYIDSADSQVGIGTTAPSKELTIVGSAEIRPKDPVIVSSLYSTNFAATGFVYVLGKYAYVTGMDADTFNIVDISDPTNPAIVSTITDTRLNGAEGVYIAGKYAYVAGFYAGTFNVIDISNPNSPSIVASIEDHTNLDGAEDIYISGKYAYVTAYFDDKLNVIDISDPANPFIVGTTDTGLDGALVLVVQGRYAYVTARFADTFNVIDISDPTNPSIVGSVTEPTKLNGPNDVYVSGKYAYVPAYVNDYFNVIDISDPTDPFIVGSVQDHTYLNTPFCIKVAGKYAYVTALDGDMLTVLDISDPTNPVVIGSVQDHTELNGADDIDIAGKYAYITANLGSRLTIVELDGITTSTIWAGTVWSNDINVSDNIDIGNSLYVGYGLNAGPGGVTTDGLISTSGSGDNYFAGNVGIGTTDPSATLDVAGGAVVTLPSTPQLVLAYDATNNATFAVSNGGDLTINAYGGDIDFGNENLKTTGTVGINTSPVTTSKLIIADDLGTGGDNVLLLDIDKNAAVNANGINIDWDDTSGGWSWEQAKAINIDMDIASGWGPPNTMTGISVDMRTTDYTGWTDAVGLLLGYYQSGSSATGGIYATEHAIGVLVNEVRSWSNSWNGYARGIWINSVNNLNQDGGNPTGPNDVEGIYLGTTRTYSTDSASDAKSIYIHQTTANAGNAYGLYINGITSTSGTEYGLYVADTSALYVFSKNETNLPLN